MSTCIHVCIEVCVCACTRAYVLFLYLYTHYIYIYIYIRVCVCVCVCVYLPNSSTTCRMWHKVNFCVATDFKSDIWVCAWIGLFKIYLSIYLSIPWSITALLYFSSIWCKCLQINVLSKMQLCIQILVFGHCRYVNPTHALINVMCMPSVHDCFVISFFIYSFRWKWTST